MPPHDETQTRPAVDREGGPPPKADQRPGSAATNGPEGVPGGGGGVVNGDRVLRRGSMFDNVPVQTVSADGSYTAVLVVPTGIGAAIGGYAGDALPVAR